MNTLLKAVVALSIIGLTSCDLISRKDDPTLTESFNNKMQSMSSAELGSVECKICKVIKADDKAEWYKFGDRKILFECRGIVKAGVDLGESNSYKADINEDAKSITLTLPAAKILAINLSPENTKMVYEKVSKTRFDFDAVERTELLRQGEAAIRKDISKETDILKEAEKNTTSFFTAMLSQLGFKQITIKYKEA